MIIESLGLIARRDNGRELATALSFLLGPTQAESGCVSCRLYQHVSSPNRFHLECCWTSEADLIRHLRADNYRQFLLVMELSAEPPQLQFHTVAGTRGMDLVQEVRAQSLELPRGE
jgi:quinol monooxygenase YgiN